MHWTSGIELAVRLIAWTWIRRLLDGWPGVTALFEENEDAACQLYWHQRYLSAYRSTGSSANNHAVAEAAGLLTASCAFPWFPESERWRAAAGALLERELERNTFPSGVNRELASDYHRLVTELGMVAAVEAEAAGHPVTDATWARLCRMLDAAAALVDEGVKPPRQGDGDDGQALLVDAPGAEGWSSLLAAGARLVGPAPWWPTVADDVRSSLLGALVPRQREVAGLGNAMAGRPECRPAHFGDAGITVLRATSSDEPEIWCRCDGGPHGFLSLAAHAHADALSIEVRHGGTEVLVDPGTYCYHGEPPWRAYFRSTIGHNTLELDGQDQSVPGGPFLWLSHASARVCHVALESPDGTELWVAEHDGYRRIDPPALHRRTVRLDTRRRRLEVIDRVEAERAHRCRLAFHLGPSVVASVDGSVALLKWSGRGPASARLQLPDRLRWTAHRGETDPIVGWYSPGFGRKQPTVTLVGTGRCGGEEGDLVSVLQFAP